MKYSKKENIGDDVSQEENELDTIELQSILKSEMDDAQDFADQLGSERAENTEYYLGDAPGDTGELQSEYVSTDVREAVLHMLPGIMRTFFGTKKVVEYLPKNANDIALSEQQTDYINYLVTQKNNGFQVFYNTFKDALVRKAGFIKAYFDQSLEVTYHDYSGLSAESRMALISDPDVELMEETATTEQRLILDEVSGEQIMQDVPVSFDIKIRRLKNKNEVKIEAVPPEEILISRNARTIETADYVAHRTMLSVSDLVAMGYDQEEVEEYKGSGYESDPDTFQERSARNPFEEISPPDRNDTNDIYYTEHFIFYDLDQDGLAERLKVCTLGSACEIVNIEPCNDLPIVMFQSDPEPHTINGHCVADYLKGIQSAKSQIMRDTLDSLGHSIFPRMVAVEGQVNLDDLLNTDIGQPIRVRQPGAVQQLQSSFVGRDAFPVLNYLDSVKEDRTGTSKASAGLNADALQSSTKTAVAATMSASQGRTELVCRHFAETGMKPLFKLIYNLVVRHQDQEEIFRLNDTFIAVDPRTWDADKDVSINVAISKNSDEERSAFLSQLVQIQKEAFQQMGAQNPLVTPQQFSNTLTKLIELAGFKDPQQFINTTVQMPEPQPPKPTGEELLAEAERDKAKAQAQKALLDAETDRINMIMKDDLERDKAQGEAFLKLVELNAKYGLSQNMADLNEYYERDQEARRQEMKLRGIYEDPGLTGME